MVNYNNGKIYKIECLGGDPNDIYIGSTTKDYLSKRMVQHRALYKFFKENKGHHVSSFNIFDKYGVENCIITLLENVNVNSKEELLARESYYIRTLECVNKVIPNRTRKEYQRTDKYKERRRTDKYKEYQKEYMKKYIEENKEKRKEYMKEYYKKNKKSNVNINERFII